MVRLAPERFDALMALVARAPLSPAEAVAVREWHEQALAQVRAEAAKAAPSSGADDGAVRR